MSTSRPILHRTVAGWRRALVALGACAVTMVAGCDVGRVIPGRAEPATPHARYADGLRQAGLDSTALGRDWLVAADSVLRAALVATLPMAEAAAYTRDEARAVAYRVALRDGQRLQVQLEARGVPARLFVDLFEVTGDSLAPFVHRATGLPQPDSTGPAVGDSVPVAARLALTHEADADGEYVVRVQPELLREGRFTIRLEVAPALAFPVQGAGNRAIRSLFGVARDGGARAHHGIDIFAPRGTPVLAVAPGIVRSTSPNRLGGNVVWLSDPDRGQTYYYAHLDGHAVTAGTTVAVGDTLGFVGNTGNARTTPPHLHFGIYRRGRGPVDPLQHVWRQPTAREAVTAGTAWLGQPARTRNTVAVLRRSPSARSDTVRRVPPRAALQVRGATGSWLRVVLADGTAGYLLPAAVQGVGE